MGKSVEATARHADGWLPIFFDPEKFQQVWGDDLAAGLAERDPTLGPLQISAGGMVAIGDEYAGDGADARARPRPPADGAVRRRHGRPGQELLQHDLPEVRLRRRGGSEIQDLYLAGRKEEAAAAVPRADARQVPTWSARRRRRRAHRRLQGGRRDAPVRSVAGDPGSGRARSSSCAACSTATRPSARQTMPRSHHSDSAQAAASRAVAAAAHCHVSLDHPLDRLAERGAERRSGCCW